MSIVQKTLMALTLIFGILAAGCEDQKTSKLDRTCPPDPCGSCTGVSRSDHCTPINPSVSPWTPMLIHKSASNCRYPHVDSFLANTKLHGDLFHQGNYFLRVQREEFERCWGLDAATRRQGINVANESQEVMHRQYGPGAPLGQDFILVPTED